MSAKVSYFKIGLVVIGATLIAVAMVIVLGAGILFQKKTMIETYFKESVQGLDVGAPLNFRGVGFGKVEEIKLAGREYPTDLRYILVRASMPDEVFQLKKGTMTRSSLEEEIKKGLRIKLGYQGLTGSVHLEMDYLDPRSNPPFEIDWTPRYIYLPSAPSTITRLSESMDRIMKSLEKINLDDAAMHIENALNAVTKTFKGTDLPAISRQAEAFLKEIRQTNREITQVVKQLHESSVLADASAGMAAARRVMEQSEKPLTNFMGGLDRTSGSVAQMADKVDTLTADLAQDLSALKQLLGRLDGLLADQQADINTSLENIRVITDNFRALSEDLKQYPGQLLLGRPPAPAEREDRK